MLIVLALLLAISPSASPEPGASRRGEPTTQRSRFLPITCVGSATSARAKIAAGWRDTATVLLELRPDRTVDWAKSDVSWASGPGDSTAGASFDYDPAGPQAWSVDPRSFGVSIAVPRDVIAASRLLIIADGKTLYDGPPEAPVGLNLATINFERGASGDAEMASVIGRAHDADQLQLTLFSQAGAKLADASFMTGRKDRRDPLLREAMKQAVAASQGVVSDQAFCR